MINILGDDPYLGITVPFRGFGESVCRVLVCAIGFTRSVSQDAVKFKGELYILGVCVSVNFLPKELLSIKYVVLKRIVVFLNFLEFVSQFFFLCDFVPLLYEETYYFCGNFNTRKKFTFVIGLILNCAAYD